MHHSLRRSLPLTLLLASSLPGCLPTPGSVPVVSNTFDAPTAVLRVAWRKPLVTEIPLLSYKPQEFAVAAVTQGEADPLVFVGSSHGTLHAFHQRTGAEVWQHAFTGALASEPLYLPAGVSGPEPLLIVGDDDGALTTLEARTGKVRWTYRVRGAIRVRATVELSESGAPQKGAGMVYFTSGEGRLYGIDLKSGAWKWQYEREVPENFTIRGASGPLATGGRVYAGFPDGYLAVLNSSTGEVIWTRQLSGEASRFTDVDSTPILQDGALFVSSYAGGVFALDSRDGSTRWRFEMEGAGAVSLGGGRIYAVSAQSGVHCLDRKGHLLWHQAMANQGELAAPVLLGSHLLVSAASGGLFVADAGSGRLQQFFDAGLGQTGRPAISEDGRYVFVLTNAGAFFALTTS